MSEVYRKKKQWNTVISIFIYYFDCNWLFSSRMLFYLFDLLMLWFDIVDKRNCDFRPQQTGKRHLSRKEVCVCVRTTRRRRRRRRRPVSDKLCSTTTLATLAINLAKRKRWPITRNKHKNFIRPSKNGAFVDINLQIEVCFAFVKNSLQHKS